MKGILSITLAAICASSGARADCPDCEAQQRENGAISRRTQDQLYPHDVLMPKDCYVHNEPGGQCVWAALEAMGRDANLPPLFGITDRARREGWHGAGGDDVATLLTRCKIPFDDSISTYSRLKDALHKGYPVLVFFPGHAVVALGADEKSVRYMDNNHTGVVQVVSKGLFLRRWEGYGCRLLPWRRHRPRPGPGPSPDSPSPNPDQPVLPPAPAPDKPVVKAPETIPVPAPIPAPSPAVDTNTIVNQISILMDKKLDPISTRLTKVEDQVKNLNAEIRTRFIPSGK